MKKKLLAIVCFLALIQVFLPAQSSNRPLKEAWLEIEDLLYRSAVSVYEKEPIDADTKVVHTYNKQHNIVTFYQTDGSMGRTRIILDDYANNNDLLTALLSVTQERRGQFAFDIGDELVVMWFNCDDQWYTEISILFGIVESGSISTSVSYFHTAQSIKIPRRR
jgi:hypothetical protein